MSPSITIEQLGSTVIAWQKGPRHTFYEDRYRVLSKHIPLVQKATRGELFAVCDGVGSAPRGMSAAQEICNILIEFFKNVELEPYTNSINKLLNDANKEINSWGFIDSSDRPLGACAGTIIWIDNNNKGHIFHVGDTCGILIRDGVAQVLTMDHHSIDGHLSNYYGLEQLTLDYKTIQLEEDDRLLLLSDGITKNLSISKITDIVETCATGKSSLSNLLYAARAAGSTDDATAVLIDII